MKIVEAKVHGLVVDPKTQQHVVVLRELDGVRVLPIWIGQNEAAAIHRLVIQEPFPRPLTHDLVALVIEGLKAKVARVIIADLRDATFYATIIIEREGGLLSIDARPSDSIAVALRTKAVILVNEELLQAPPEQQEEGSGRPPAGPAAELTAEEKAEQLRRYLEKLNPEDFGKFEM